MLRRYALPALLLCAGPVAAQDWQLVWQDEFDVPGAPDPAKWNYDIGGHGWGNQERQFYTDRLENARVENGALVIEAREETYNGNPYTSARLVTRGTAAWQYGRIEARMKMPFGQGIWPAFWMLPTDSPYGGWPMGGEIDIMEFLGHDTDRVYGTLHYGGGDRGHQYTGTHFTLDEGTFSEDFHTFAVEWEPNRIRWFVDGELYQTQISWNSANGPYPAPFDHPFHLLLNVAVGGEWPGYPDATTTFPQTMEVDYVRVYQDADAYPVVTLDGPADGTAVAPGGTITLAATATDGGSVEEVEFLQGEGVIATLTEPPYTLDLDGVAEGCYTLRARATDDAGYVSTSEPAALTVGGGCAERSPYLVAPAQIPGEVEAEHYDLGGPDVAYDDNSESNSGTGIRQDEGVDTRPSSDTGGGSDVTDVRAREWTSYTVDVAQAGQYRVLARVATGSGSTFRLSLDGEDLLGDIAVSPTGGDTNYSTAFLGNVTLPAGRHVLRVDFKSAGLSVNRFAFSYLGSTATDEAPDSGETGLLLAPNPTTDAATLTYRTDGREPVAITVYDLTGREVVALAPGVLAPGTHTATLDVGGLAPGLYLCVVASGDDVRTARLSVSR